MCLLLTFYTCKTMNFYTHIYHYQINWKYLCTYLNYKCTWTTCFSFEKNPTRFPWCKLHANLCITFLFHKSFFMAYLYHTLAVGINCPVLFNEGTYALKYPCLKYQSQLVYEYTTNTLQLENHSACIICKVAGHDSGQKYTN